MRLFFLALGTLILALTIRPGPDGALVTPSVANEPEAEEPWYAPESEHFRPSYDQDAANRSKQTWSQYWSWVKVFYEGNILSQGWTDRSRGLVAELESGSEQKKLRAMLNAVGREIALEWAKDYNLRKISTANLLNWGKRLENAKAQGEGSGAELRRVIDAIRAEYRRKMGLEDDEGEGGRRTR
ncbi:MAG: hypothetical protein ACLQGP_33975 [Isosphaeraceae bacterium]